jgi:UrcA family protein
MKGKTVIDSLTCAMLVAGGCAMFGGMVRADSMEVVTVEAARTQKVAQTRYGVPVREITIVSRVSYADLDLKTQQGADELGKRIREAATSSCKEMDVKFPVEGYGEADCIKHAVDGAMAQANKVIAAKGGAAPK